MNEMPVDLISFRILEGISVGGATMLCKIEQVSTSLFILTNLFIIK